VRSQRFLPVICPLHGAQRRLEVSTYMPLTGCPCLSESHSFQHSQPRNDVLVPWFRRISVHSEVLGLCVCFCVACDHPIQRCESVLSHLAALRLADVQFGTVPKLSSAQILGDPPDSTSYVIAFET
jgi:hypothetical protein